MKRVNLLLITLLISGFTFANSGELITGILGTRGIPCFALDCPTLAVFQVTNDTASFVLSKNGQYIEELSELGDYSEGEIILIYGNVKKKQEYNNNEFYELAITAVLKDVSSNNFKANCDVVENEDHSTIPTISVENDSVIITQIKYEQCCAEYALRISEIINDTLYVAFSDTASDECDCMCNFTVRINAIKLQSQPKSLKVFYNGIVYELNTSGIETINKKDILIYPNPTKGRINISGFENYENLNYEIYNSIGQITQRGVLKNHINLSNENGMCFLIIKQNESIIVGKKIIVQ